MATECDGSQFAALKELFDNMKSNEESQSYY